MERVEVLLIGGGVASVRCARTLRREGFDGSITLIAEEAALPYNRPPLSKELLRDDLPDDLVAAEPARWYERRGIELRAGQAVMELDPEARVATLDGGERIGFDRCLLATGAEPMVPPIPGVEDALLLRTLPDARRLRAAALAARGGTVEIVGGGFIGVEVASSLAALGLRPVIRERAPSLWSGALGTELASWAMERLTEVGVDVRLNAPVTHIRSGDADIVIMAVGVRPRDQLAERAGLATDDGVDTDAEHRTSHPAAWAAGDVARVDRLRIEHWHAAREGGERAARSMLGLPPLPAGAPWFFSEVAGVGFDVYGVATAWDEERWVRPASVMVYLADERVVQMAVIDGAIAPDVARALVEAGASASEVERALATPG
jgi:NADPH-dependent 2,4-dienoyl-CoA reductase/sulfur reductase-like enzyme